MYTRAHIANVQFYFTVSNYLLSIADVLSIRISYLDSKLSTAAFNSLPWDSNNLSAMSLNAFADAVCCSKKPLIVSLDAPPFSFGLWLARVLVIIYQIGALGTLTGASRKNSLLTLSSLLSSLSFILPYAGASVNNDWGWLLWAKGMRSL